MKVLALVLLSAVGCLAQTAYFACGNPSNYTDTNSITWLADNGINCSGGTTFTTGSGISGTVDPTLYRFGRQSNSSLSANASLGIGIYTITLKFADVLGFTGPGQQIFNVFINGTLQVAAFDIYNTVRAQNTAYDVVIPFYANLNPAGISVQVSQVHGGAQLQAVSFVLQVIQPSSGGFPNPMTQIGDLIVGGASGLPTAVHTGTSGFCWVSNGVGNAPTWQSCPGGGGGGNPLFSAIQTGTNTSATMTVGTGATITLSGSGVVNANQINGGTMPGSGNIWKSNGSLQPIAAVANTDYLPAANPTFTGTMNGAALTLTGNLTTNVSGSTQCLHVNSLGVVSGVGADCGTTSVTIKQDGGASLGTATTLNIQTGTGMTNTISVSAGTANIQHNVNTAVITSLANLQSGAPQLCAPSSASSSTYTCSMSPTLTAYTGGMELMWKPDVTCSGAVTLNIDTLGAKSVLTTGGANPTCTGGRYYVLTYDSANTAFRLLTPDTTSSLPTTANLILIDDFHAVYTAGGGTCASGLIWASPGGSGTGSNSCVSNGTFFPGHPGVIFQESGNAAGNVGYFNMAASGSPVGILGTGMPYSTWTMTWIVSPCNEAACSTAGAAAAMGSCFGAFASGGGGCPAATGAGFDGVAFAADTAGLTCTTGTFVAGDWNYILNDGANHQNCIDSTVTYTYNTWHKFTVTSSSAGTVQFCIDGANCQTASTNMPTTNMNIGSITTSRGAANKFTNYDYFSFVGQGLSR